MFLDIPQRVATFKAIQFKMVKKKVDSELCLTFVFCEINITRGRFIESI